MKLNCLIVDDEPYAHRILKKYITDLSYLHLSGECFSALEAFEFLNKQSIDIIFLDINMPKMTGISFLKALTGKSQVIITTAHPDFAMEGFDLHVCDYLLKPIIFERFIKAVNKAYMLSRQAGQILQEISSAENILGQKQVISIKSEKKIYQLGYDDILIIESIGNYAKIYTKDSILVTLETLKNMEERLPGNLFIRVNKSFIVSIPNILYIEGNCLVIGPQKKEVVIGRFYRNALLQKLKGK